MARYDNRIEGSVGTGFGFSMGCLLALLLIPTIMCGGCCVVLGIGSAVKPTERVER